MPECIGVHSGRGFLQRKRCQTINNKSMEKQLKKLIWIMIKMKLMCLVVVWTATSLNAEVWSQERKIDLRLGETNLELLLEEMQEQTNLRFIYNHEDVSGYVVNGSMKNKTVAEILDKALKGIPLKYEIVGDHIVISPEQLVQAQSGVVMVKGKVTTPNGEPLPGVTILLKGTSLGTATDVNGNYELAVSDDLKGTLVFSFIGMKTREIAINGRTEIAVTMEEEATEIDDVVVTGYFNKSKNSFTGAVTQTNREELRKFGNANLIQALSMVDPSFKIRENNLMGSDPNTLPDFFIRGESSFMGESNIPTFIVDGYEVSLQRVFDMDVERIESLTILKDASATILYGSRAANGVVVIETRRPESGKFAVSYSNRTTLSIADLTDYDLMDAKEKLDYEQKAGLFDPDDLNDMEMLEYIKSNVWSGVNTDWLAQPVRNAVSHAHSLYLEGGTDAVVYGLGANYNRENGVIKKSFREVLGLSFDLTYRHKDKISIRNSFEFNQTKVQNSPYGSFSDYAKANPYNPIYDGEGNLIRTYKSHTYGTQSEPQYQNPLYNATLPYKDEEEIVTIINNLNVDYYFTRDLRFRASVALTKTLNSSDKYISPEHSQYADVTDATERGEYTKGVGNSFSYNINSTLNYTLQSGKHVFFTGIGLNIIENKSKSNSFTATGFLDERFYEPEFASTYLQGGKPQGSEGTDRMIGFLGNINYSYDNRYFLDLSGRVDGSSKYGKDKRFAPLWSAGIGWNINNEHFLDGADWLTRLTIRGSIGLTGNQNFDPYVAKTTLQLDTDQVYYEALGASFITYGNERLEWQRSKKRNLGLDLEILQRRLTIRFDYYNDLTTGLLLPVSVTPSLGFSSYTENLGQQRNVGYEFDVNAVIVRNEDFDWAVNINGTHNENRIEKISNALRTLNTQNNADEENQTQPIAMYEEGESLNAIKVVQSLGINPANGKELFLTKDGEITETWDYRDKIVAGCEDAKLEGDIGTNFIWKNLTVNVLFGYRLGGQLYNTTLSERVEGADPTTNADKRVLEQRWQKPGDYTFYKDIADRTVSNASSRFVQDYNYLELSNLSISYRFNPQLLKKIGFSSLRIGLNTNNLFYVSTVKRERGLDYPFAGEYTFSLNLNF